MKKIFNVILTIVTIAAIPCGIVLLILGNRGRTPSGDSVATPSLPLVLERIEAVPSEGPAPLLVKFKAVGVSYDPKNSPLKYEWIFGENATLKPDSAEAEHKYETVGRYAVLLTITDAKGNKVEATTMVQVSVQPPPATPPATLPLSPVAIKLIADAEAAAAKAAMEKAELAKQLAEEKGKKQFEPKLLPGLDQVKVDLDPIAWSGWVVTPAKSDYRIDVDPEGGYFAEFRDGYIVEVVKDGSPVDVGLRRGIFRLKGKVSGQAAVITVCPQK